METDTGTLSDLQVLNSTEDIAKPTTTRRGETGTAKAEWQEPECGWGDSPEPGAEPGSLSPTLYVPWK